ncbi:hypothetical protein EIP86_011345 [Pleurotus ostreatoroseus]|nr:hypothetical protein EIP86_011345 [Pleurotus ostreatoroseus]
MGLAGRKVKQRIPHDPRNLSWADDANKFGAAYLAKLGWSSGSGLGVNGEGRTTHIKVSQKLDMLGIGHAHQNNPNGIAWKQNNDFESLLRRLNAGGEEAEKDIGTKVEGFAKAGAEAAEDDAEERDMKESKKRKRDDATHEEGADEDEVSKAEKKKKNKEKKDKKDKQKKSKDVDEKADDVEPSPSPSITPTPTPPARVGPFRAHRARFLASKRLATKHASAMDEILGISRSGTATPYPSTSIPDTPIDSSSATTPSAESDDLKLQELTTSSKSVMDYFREKLAAKSNASTTSSSAAQSPGLGTPKHAETEDYDDYDDRPRGGLGLGASRAGLGTGLSFTQKTTAEVEETERRGISSSSGFRAMFTSATTLTSTSDEDVKVETDILEVENVEVIQKEKKEKTRRKQEAEEVESSKKEKKSKRRKEKEKASAEVDEAAALDDSEDVAAQDISDDQRRREKKEKKERRKREKANSAVDEEHKPREKKKKKSKEVNVEA